MFDDIICEVPLPDNWEGDRLQTKDLDSCLDSYKITLDGRLLREQISTEEVPKDERYIAKDDSFMEKMNEISSSAREVSREWIDQNHHGRIYFYGSENAPEEDRWVQSDTHTSGGFLQSGYRNHNYVAKFTNGNLTSISLADDNGNLTSHETDSLIEKSVERIVAAGNDINALTLIVKELLCEKI